MEHNAENIATIKALLTTQERAQAIIDAWRGLPGELMMLKGLLCVEQAMQDAYRKAGAHIAFAMAASDIGIDTVLIAKRMDELYARPFGGAA